MAAYNLSSFAGAGAQFFDDNGNPLSGGKVYTYAGGTTTPLATYTTSAGTVANANPIILDAAGRTPNEIWLNVGTLYKFIVKTSVDVLVGTYDSIPAINDPFSINALLGSVTGTNTIAANATPAITAYAAGATYSFIAVNTNTAAVTISINGLPAKSVTKNGTAALVAGDIQAGKLMWVEYDGTTFQLINNAIYGGSITNGTIVSLTTPLGADSGGTGLATIAANSVMLGNGIAAVQTVAPGTTGNVLTSNGTTWSSSASGGRLLRAPQLLTSGTSYTTPAGCTSVNVEVVGGGGGGGGGSGSGTAVQGAGGGGGGATAVKLFTVTPSTAYTYAIGAAGSAGASGASGGAGGSTTFTVGATTITGGGGGGGNWINANGFGGAGGTATNGDLNMAGQGGGAAAAYNTFSTGGTGGSSYLGGGAYGKTASNAGAAATGYGGGGGGGAVGGNAGGVGFQGVIRIWEYS